MKTQLFTIQNRSELENECSDLGETSVAWLYDHVNAFLKVGKNIQKYNRKVIIPVLQECPTMRKKEYKHYVEIKQETSLYDAVKLVAVYLKNYIDSDKDSILREEIARENAKAAFRIYGEIFPYLWI